jgi:hypothetical protein
VSGRVFVYNLNMLGRRTGYLLGRLSTLLLAFPMAVLSQQPPPASSARILLLPKRIVSGEPATLAVLDISGRLTPGVTVNFSNGDHLITDTTGRALFVAPRNPGVIYATIASRPTRVYTTVLAPVAVSSTFLEVTSAPRFASLADRFELSGRGFCGAADANAVRVGGKPALILAASPTTLIALPPTELDSGPAVVEASCSKGYAPAFSITFLALTLDVDSAPLAPGEHRTLTVRIVGTAAKVPVEARNLSPDIAELSGGNSARVSSSGGAENAAHFELTARTGGNFLISLRLLPTPTLLRP